jgi:hypothetical protein
LSGSAAEQAEAVPSAFEEQASWPGEHGGRLPPEAIGRLGQHHSAAMARLRLGRHVVTIPS